MAEIDRLRRTEGIVFALCFAGAPRLRTGSSCQARPLLCICTIEGAGLSLHRRAAIGLG